MLLGLFLVVGQGLIALLAAGRIRVAGLVAAGVEAALFTMTGVVATE